MKEKRFTELTMSKIKAIVTCIDRRRMTVKQVADFLWYEEWAIEEGYRIGVRKGISASYSSEEKIKNRAVGIVDDRPVRSGVKGRTVVYDSKTRQRLRQDAEDCLRHRKGLPRRELPVEEITLPDDKPKLGIQKKKKKKKKQRKQTK